MSNEHVELNQEVIDTALDVLEELKITPFGVEVPFIDWQFGFGGRIDLIGEWPEDPEDEEGDVYRRLILDWKFRETKPDRPITMWDDYIICLAGYGVGYTAMLPHRLIDEYDLVNVVVSVNEPGRWEMKVWSPKEIDHAWRVFNADLKAWFVDKKYDPREGPNGDDEEE